MSITKKNCNCSFIGESHIKKKLHTKFSAIDACRDIEGKNATYVSFFSP